MTGNGEKRGRGETRPECVANFGETDTDGSFSSHPLVNPCAHDRDTMRIYPAYVSTGVHPGSIPNIVRYRHSVGAILTKAGDGWPPAKTAGGKYTPRIAVMKVGTHIAHDKTN